jgi:hypothetical protein
LRCSKDSSTHDGQSHFIQLLQPEFERWLS